MTRNLVAELKLSRKEQQILFNTALHADARGGKVFFTTLLNGEVICEKISSNISGTTSMEKDGNVFVSLNTFSKDTRSAANTYNIGAFFIDMDGHGLSDSELSAAKKNTVKILKQAVSSGLFCEWSMLTDTGRGLGIYILLGQSIPAYGKCQKSVRFYNAIYRMLLERVQMILDSCPEQTLEVDHTIMDKARLCRLPGTYNFKAHAECILLEYNVDVMEEVLRFSLWGIVHAAGLSWASQEEQNRERKQALKTTEGKVHNLSNYLFERKRKLELLQSLRESWEGVRELFCFAYYNCVKQLYGKKDAIAHLHFFNDSFPDGGIHATELENVIHSVDRNISASGKYGGYYKLTEEWICNTLNVDPEEKKICRFGQKSETLLRHERVVNDRIQTHKAVVAAIIKNSNWQEVADATSMSLRAVKKIGKQYQCTMRDKLSSVGDVDWEMVKKNMMLGKSRKKEDEVKMIDANKEPLDDKDLFSDICMEIGIDEVQSDIEKSNSFEAIQLKDYAYGQSFLSYIFDQTKGKYHEIVAEFMDAISDIKDKKMLEKTLSAVNYLAECYAATNSLEAAAYDLSHMASALHNGHLSVCKYGLPCSPKDYEKKKEYPEAFEPVMSMENRISTYKDIFYTANPEYEAAIQEVISAYHQVIAYSKIENVPFVIPVSRSTTVRIRRKTLLDRINRLNIYELAKLVISTYNRKKQRIQNSMQHFLKAFFRATEKHTDFPADRIASNFIKLLFPPEENVAATA